MHYLKCSNCGHFNELKTEYLVFCSACGKRLVNNYSDWIKRNPGKSIDEFRQEVCTTENTSQDTKKSSSGKTKGIRYWIGFTIVFASAMIIGQLGGDKITSFFSKPAFDQSMMAMASEINKTCPIMVDNATRLDNAIALPDNVFQYNYTLVDMIRDSVNIEELKGFVEPTIINFVRTNPDMETIRKNDVIIKYYYKDKAGNYLFTITVTPEQYK